MRTCLAILWFASSVTSFIMVWLIAALQKEMEMVVELTPVVGMGVMVILATVWLRRTLRRRVR